MEKVGGTAHVFSIKLTKREWLMSFQSIEKLKVSVRGEGCSRYCLSI